MESALFWNRIVESGHLASEQGDTGTCATANVRSFHLGREEGSGAGFRLSGQRLRIVAQLETHDLRSLGYFCERVLAARSSGFIPPWCPRTLIVWFCTLILVW